jgi:hypothetical protein
MYVKSIPPSVWKQLSRSVMRARVAGRNWWLRLRWHLAGSTYSLAPFHSNYCTIMDGSLPAGTTTRHAVSLSL